MAFYTMKPRRGVKTQKAGWMSNPDNVQYDERVEITRGLKKDAINAKIVLDLGAKTVTRNGWGDNRSFNDLFKYFFKGYHQYVTTVMTQLDPKYFNLMLDEMQAELDAEKNQDEPAAESV